MKIQDRAAANLMTTSSASNDDQDATIATTEALLERLPEDFRHLAEEFQRQSSFYQQLMHQASSSGQPGQQKDFWNIPDSHGFSGHNRLDLEDPWFQSLFSLSNSSDPFGLQMVEQWSKDLQSFSVEAQSEVMAFQEAGKVLSKVHQQVAERARALFEEKLEAIDKDDPDQLCQAWLQAGETAFQEISKGDEFLDNQAALFNALSRLKTLQSNLANRFSSGFGLPHQTELAAFRQGLHDLRMAFAEYRQHTTQEINELQRQLARKPGRKRSPKT